jgi:DNA-binding IscR family transcriptional regulator
MAVHVLSVLAYKDGERLTSSLLASSVNTNPVVIRRLLLALQRGGLIETRKGVGSGSCLSRAPGKISLADVYRAVDAGQGLTLPPKKPNAECPVGSCIQRTLSDVFSSVEEAVLKNLKKMTLGTVVEQVNQCCSKKVSKL